MQFDIHASELRVDESCCDISQMSVLGTARFSSGLAYLPLGKTGKHNLLELLHAFPP
jgi:hypothetical protein